MENFSIVVEESLGVGRYVVTNLCRTDIPLGTKFHNLWAQRSTRVGDKFVVDLVTPITIVNVKVVAIEFWRKVWHCIPHGHHAGAVLEGEDEALLASFLAQHAGIGSSICLSSGPPFSPVSIFEYPKSASGR
jgi:hypothetical protein